MGFCLSNVGYHFKTSRIESRNLHSEVEQLFDMEANGTAHFASVQCSNHIQ